MAIMTICIEYIDSSNIRKDNCQVHMPVKKETSHYCQRLIGQINIAIVYFLHFDGHN